MIALLAACEIDAGYAADAPLALRHVSLSLVSGEMVGVVGPNGSGKSTLVRALSRVLRPRAGTVLLAGKDLYALVSARDAARAIGVVPQSASLSLAFTVREIVGMGRAPYASPRLFASPTARDAEITEDALRAAGVHALAERVATTLSGGEWQRVLLARALAQQPSVLLLDEPTAHLDLAHQWETLTQARALAHEGGKAVLAVLHDLNLAAAFCDRLLLLSEGRIAAQGTPAEVLTPALLEKVYGARVWVGPHPVTGCPLVLPLSPG